MRKSCLFYFVTLAFLASCGNKSTTINTVAPKASEAEATPKQEKLVLNVAHCNGEDHPYAYGLIAFKDKLEQLSGGSVTAELFHGTMGESEGELTQRFNAGDISVYVTAPNLVPIPEVELFSLEYLFDSFNHWATCMDGAFGQELSDIITQKTNNQYRVLGYWSSGIRDYYGNKPIKSPEDVAGLKMRVSSSPVQIKFWEDCGAQTQQVGWGDLYNALNSGEVDAAENDYTSMMLKNHHKTPSGHYICETDHDFTTRFFIMSGELFDSFTPEQQDIIIQAAQYATGIERQQTYELTSSSKAKVIEDGAEVTEATDIDMDAFRAIAYPIQDEFAKEHGFEHFLELVRLEK